MKKEAIEKIAEEISNLHNLSDVKANAIVNKVVKLISQNGYSITSDEKQRLKREEY